MGSNLAPHPFVHRQTYRLVKITLIAFEHNPSHDLGLRRQIGLNLAFCPPQQKRLQAPCQQQSASVIAILFDWRAETPSKPAPVAEEPRHQKCKLRPDFAEVVL